MLCPVCHTFRPANYGPCPQCNAPSTLAREQNGSYFAPNYMDSWGRPVAPTSGDEWNTSVSPNSSQAYDNSPWGQVMQEQADARYAPAPEPALPVPYAGGQMPASYNMTPGFPTSANQWGGTGGALIPAQPAGDSPIYIPPMYTKPRAIIPRYRVISGLISFIVVIGLLCAGGIYYAKATGKLTFLRQLYDPQFQNIKPSPTVLLPNPKVSADYGPAYTIINSATTASSIEPGTSQPANPTNRFQVGDPIYVTYSIHSTTQGKVQLRWFTNGLDYFNSTPITIPAAKNGVSGYTKEVYPKPTQGKVEIYWNGQLAIRLYFVVEPNSP